MSWPQIRKIVVLKYRLLLFCATIRNHFLIRLWLAMKSGFHRTTGDQQPNGWTGKKLQSTFQSKTCIKKGHDLLVVCCWSDPLQLSESWQNHYIWEVCSADLWDAPKTAVPAAGVGQQKGPASSPWQSPPRLTPVLQKLNELGCGVLPHSPFSPDLSSAYYHFFKHLDNFLGENAF